MDAYQERKERIKRNKEDPDNFQLTPFDRIKVNDAAYNQMSKIDKQRFNEYRQPDFYYVIAHIEKLMDHPKHIKSLHEMIKHRAATNLKYKSHLFVFEGDVFDSSHIYAADMIRRRMSTVKKNKEEAFLARMKSSYEKQKNWDVHKLDESLGKYALYHKQPLWKPRDFEKWENEQKYAAMKGF